MNKLSHSRINMYTRCPKSYDLHYNRGFRERGKSSALLFGSAIDKALEARVQNPECDPFIVFEKMWEEQEINGRRVKLATDLSIKYYGSDLDMDLFDSEDVQRMYNTFIGGQAVTIAEKRAAVIDELEDVLIAKKAKGSIGEHCQKLLNMASWMSLRHKGTLMIKAYLEHIEAKIKKAIGTQVVVDLKNEDGDAIIGYADLHCIWEDGREMIIDFKTASKPYAPNAVKASQQLALYCHALGVPYAGYVVFVKSLLKEKKKVCESCGFEGTGGRHKTCPNESEGKRCGGLWTEETTAKVDVQVLIDTIPPRTEEIMLENTDEVNRGIKANVFPRNFSACDNNFGRCAFYNLCHKGDASDLDKVQ